MEINNCMITSDQAVQDLLDVCKGVCHSGASYSEIKDFTPNYPKKTPPAFILDSKPKQIGTGTRDRT